MRVLCFGSANIDYVYPVPHFVSAGETLAAGPREVHPGGKGLNQAVALARAGAETAFAGRAGKDGLFLKKLLEDSSVTTVHFELLDGEPTGHAVIQRDPSGQNCILLYAGANGTVDPAFSDTVLSGYGRGDILLVQNEIPYVPHIIRKAKSAGMTVAVNPSPVSEEMRNWPWDCVDLIILNETEGAFFARYEKLTAADIPALRSRFPDTDIVLTLGAEGSVYGGSAGTFSVPAYPAEAVDTTGAGDTYTGYLIAELARGSSVRSAMDTASKAAAVAVSRPGAASSIPFLSEVKA